MTNRALVMPAYVAELASLPLMRLGLDPMSGDDLITCPLKYQDGTELSVAILCIATRGWFREKPMVAFSLVKLDEHSRAVSVYIRKVRPYPTGPHDLSFSVRVSALVRAMAWAHAVTGGMGECVDLPGRPA